MLAEMGAGERLERDGLEAYGAFARRRGMRKGGCLVRQVGWKDGLIVDYRSRDLRACKIAHASEVRPLEDGAVEYRIFHIRATNIDIRAISAAKIDLSQSKNRTQPDFKLLIP
jgi:hypothetical protein